MLGNCGQTRYKISLSRIPPWRRWVRGRETVPSVAFKKTLDVERIYFSRGEPKLALAPSECMESKRLLEGQSAEIRLMSDDKLVVSVIESLPNVRKFLIPTSSHSRRTIKALDRLCVEIESALPNIPEEDRVRILSAFGELREFSVKNRVADRYNSGNLVYMNSEFYSNLAGSISWESVFSNHLSRARSLAPTLHVLRTVSKMSLGEKVMSLILSDVLKSTAKIGSPKPVHLTELMMLASKNRVVHAEFFEYLISDLSENFDEYCSRDLLGDICRSFTTLSFYSSSFHELLLEELPELTHELSWWNLVDIAEYFSKVIPTPFSDLDAELTARFANECWKWIPEMRCGYAAKALRVLTDLNLGDKRTIRSLIRSIPKSLEKLHPNVAAESLVSAVKFGYDPRNRYGKRSGAVLYRRLAFKLSTENALERVNADLILSVVESLSKIQRPQFELFDFIVRDVVAAKDRKYSLDHLVSLERIFGESFNFLRGSEILNNIISSRHQTSTVNINNLAYLARSQCVFYPQLVDSGLMSQISIENAIGLCKYPGFTQNHLEPWLDMNLSNLNPSDLVKLVVGLAENGTDLPLEKLHWINLVSEKSTFSSHEESVQLIASLMIISKFSLVLSARIFETVTNKPLNPDAVETCQLIGALIRTDPSFKVEDHIKNFLAWIEAHLFSKHPSSATAGTIRPWYVPNGAVTDLSVFPVCVPLALPDPRLDIRSLHQARNPTSVRRLHASVHNDSGIALLFEDINERKLKKILKHLYLNRLGWTVKYILRDSDVSDPNHITCALVGHSSTDEKIHSIGSF